MLGVRCANRLGRSFGSAGGPGYNGLVPGEESQDQPSIARLLSQARAGQDDASAALLRLLYGDLRAMAGAIFSSQPANHTLQPTALVNEAWLKLAAHVNNVEDRQHFLRVAARAMRQVVADHARGKQRDKRDAGRRVTLDTSHPPASREEVDLVALDDSLRRLAERNERHATIAELRLFGGLSIDETAAALDVSPRTVDTDWALAKAWLRVELKGDG